MTFTDEEKEEIRAIVREELENAEITVTREPIEETLRRKTRQIGNRVERKGL